MALDRKKIIQQMKEKGIETAIGTWNIPMTSYFRTRYSYRLGDFPTSNTIFNRTLTLPLYERLDESQQREVVRQLLSFCP